MSCVGGRQGITYFFSHVQPGDWIQVIMLGVLYTHPTPIPEPSQRHRIWILIYGACAKVSLDCNVCILTGGRGIPLPLVLCGKHLVQYPVALWGRPSGT